MPDSCILFCFILYREVPREHCLTKAQLRHLAPHLASHSYCHFSSSFYPLRPWSRIVLATIMALQLNAAAQHLLVKILKSETGVLGIRIVLLMLRRWALNRSIPQTA